MKRSIPLLSQRWFLLLLVALLLMPACAAPLEPAAGQATTEAERNQRAEGHTHMVAAAHPLAAEAGLEMLERGGNAVDAAVATTFVLEVVEPMMSGIGGGGALTIWDNEAGQAEYIDAYASAGGDPDYELEELSGDEISRERRVAVPGAVAGLYAAHEAHGTLPWEELLQPAIQVAREGFPVHTLLARVIADNEEKLTYDPEAARVFYPDGEPLQAGDWLERPDLAATLEDIAREGRAGFYEGPVAEELIAKLSRGGNPLTLEDLRDFEPKHRGALCGTYGHYTVLTAPPPLAGMELLQVLGLLEDAGIERYGLPSRDPEALNLVVDAIRLARADRMAFLGDPQDGDVPALQLYSPEYIAQRRSLMGGPVPGEVEPGMPERVEATLPEACQELGAFTLTAAAVPEADAHRPVRQTTAAEEEQQHTTHVSIVDQQGNAVSLTYTMGLYFGAGVYAGGAFFNTAAGNFGDEPAANRRGPYRTPRSSTAPTIVLEGDSPRLVVGSPGSGRIVPAITHMILYTLNHGLDPAQALRQPRIYPFVNSETVEVEGGFAAEALARMRERGYTLEANPPFDLYFGGVHMIEVRDDGSLVGAADPRREGVALGR